jgi:hypothetical protein
MAVRFVNPRWRSIGHKQYPASFDNPPKRP